MRKINKIVVIMFTIVLITMVVVTFAGGEDDLPDSPSVQNVNTIQADEGMSVYWSIHKRSRRQDLF